MEQADLHSTKQFILNLYLKSVSMYAWLENIFQFYRTVLPVPSIAQLVERWTVEERISIGHWFESGSKENLFLQINRN